MISVKDDPQGYILSKRGLAIAIAKRFCRSKQSKRDDIRGAAILGLCCAVNRIQTGEYKPVDQQHTDAYVASTIIGHVRSFLENDYVLRVPRKAYKEEMLREHPFVVTCFNESSLVTKNDSGGEDSLEQISPATGQERNREADRLILVDILLGMDLTDREIKVLQYLRDGYSDTEIGEKLGRSRQAINLNIQSLRQKYRQYWFCHKDDLLNPITRKDES